MYDELYHFGIKGQKWGVRRYQNKDGSLTNAGKKRYDDGSVASTKKVSKHRLYLEKKYREKGMSEAEAAKAAERRIKTERIIGITAGVTVAACTAYYLRNKYLADRCDQVLKSGTTFHNLHSERSERPGEHLYVNYRQNDKDYFRGHFALGKVAKTGNAYDHVLTAKEDIKIPSLKTRKETFKQLYDNDLEFRQAFKTHSGIHANSTPKANEVYKRMWRKMGDKNDPAFNVAKRKYYDALRGTGYEAIVDEWDTSRGVFRSDAPLILLNTSSKSLGEMKISELTANDVLLSQANSRHYEPTRSVLNSFALPHTNHFKESDRYLKRYAAKSVKNEKYLDKVAEKYIEQHGTQKTVDTFGRMMFRKEGHVLADAGRYLSKNEKMTLDEAMKKARKKDDVMSSLNTAAQLAGTTATVYAPVKGVTVAMEQRAIEKYIAEHPNTKLTTAEIRKKYRRHEL